jgi:hypothetical protein
MKLREQIQAEITAAEAEIAAMKAHLASGEPWLEQEVDSFKMWWHNLIEAIRGKPVPPAVGYAPPAPPPDFPPPPAPPVA